MSERVLVPIEERGGRRYPAGTVYYSKNAGGFLSAGFEEEGVLPLDAVSGRVNYSIDRRGVARFRDETGVFVKTGVFIRSAGTSFTSRFINWQDFEVAGNPFAADPRADGFFVERQQILLPDGTVKVIEIKHGVGKEYDPDRQSKQWYRKMREELGDYAADKTTEEMQAFIHSKEVILRVNLGPVTQGG